MLLRKLAHRMHIYGRVYSDRMHPARRACDLGPGTWDLGHSPPCVAFLVASNWFRQMPTVHTATYANARQERALPLAIRPAECLRDQKSVANSTLISEGPEVLSA